MTTDADHAAAREAGRAAALDLAGISPGALADMWEAGRAGRAPAPTPALGYTLRTAAALAVRAAALPPGTPLPAVADRFVHAVERLREHAKGLPPGAAEADPRARALLSAVVAAGDEAGAEAGAGASVGDDGGDPLPTDGSFAAGFLAGVVEAYGRG